MAHDVVDLRSVDRTQVELVGGKGASLGELVRLEGVDVPAGICVTTDAYRRIVEAEPAIAALVARLSTLDPTDTGAIRDRSAEIRVAVEELTLPDDLVDAVTAALGSLGGDRWAVRSSATAEDLPGTSFAGQHDSHLDVAGAAVPVHVRRCWASLFTERAVTYRLRNGIDHGDVRMAVVVQEMVHPEAAGVLFTADPVTSNRRVAVVEAVAGLGEALVSGLVDPDSYRVRGGEVVAASAASGRPVLTDAEVVQLVVLGRRIEAHLGHPQDIEWCLADGRLVVVQSRPITTLFPIPAADDDTYRVYLSVGHQQMMTDPIRPLGISVWQLTAGPPMHEAGGRLFVDVTDRLASLAMRDALLELMGRSDPLMRDALEQVLEGGEIGSSTGDGPPLPLPSTDATTALEADPGIVAELIAENEASVAALELEIRAHTGPALLDFIRADILELKRLLFDPRSMQVILAGMNASHWLDEHLEQWLGVRGAADVLTRSAPGNVTSEMGLALLDVADVVRPHPEVVDFLRTVDDDDDFLDDLAALDGGPAAADAIRAYLDAYGMRCIGEIDITRPRWRERPSMLVPMLLTDVDAFEAGEHARRVEAGREQAARAEHDLLEGVRALPDGEARAAEAKRMIDRVRTFIGYREYPKYGLVRRYGTYKRAILEEADRLVAAGVLGDPEDVFFLTFQELHDVARTHQVDPDRIRRRREELRSHEALTPPRVLTSDGEALVGAYHRVDLPTGALVGLAVSSGTVEGRARVVLDMGRADLEPGDILVTRHTDPSWSPLFVAVAGVVTEVGGLMTHGAVIAREYGLPAVVGVEGATRRIRDGQRIRVDGAHGYVELLPDP